MSPMVIGGLVLFGVLSVPLSTAVVDASDDGWGNPSPHPFRVIRPVWWPWLVLGLLRRKLRASEEPIEDSDSGRFEDELPPPGFG